MPSVQELAYFLRYLALPLGVSFAISAGLTLVVRSSAHRFGLLDKPGEHKQHEAPTPTLGGIPVFLAFLVGCLLSGPLTKPILCLLQSSVVLVAVGVCDDIWGVRAKLKLGVLFFGTFWLWRQGIYLDAFGLIAPGALVLTFLWVGLVSSAFNGVDNSDGAAGGLAFISAVSTFCISWMSWQRNLAVVALVLAGACLGFLVFNFPRPRATIFLGDSGSLFLGFGLAFLTILGEWSAVGWKSGCVALLLVFVPLFDFLFILVTRGVDGRYKHWEDPIKMCGRDHLSHRLRRLGLNSKQVLVFLYGLGALAGACAVAIVREPEILTLGRLAQGVLACVVLAAGLKFVPLPPDAFPER